jgi:hypothetical protein
MLLGCGWGGAGWGGTRTETCMFHLQSTVASSVRLGDVCDTRFLEQAQIADGKSMAAAAVVPLELDDKVSGLPIGRAKGSRCRHSKAGGCRRARGRWGFGEQAVAELGSRAMGI